jgi:hypothetical protein
MGNSIVAKSSVSRSRKHIIKECTGNITDSYERPDCSARFRGRIGVMTYLVAGEIEGRVLASVGERHFLPHLVCSWTLDPASRRLSCAWAPPTGRWDVPSLSPRITATILGTGLARPLRAL